MEPKPHCCFFLQGRCLFEKCRFSHNLEAPVSRCIYGPGCRLDHWHLGRLASEVVASPGARDIEFRIAELLRRGDTLVCQLGDKLAWRYFKKRHGPLQVFLESRPSLFRVWYDSRGRGFVCLTPSPPGSPLTFASLPMWIHVKS